MSPCLQDLYPSITRHSTRKRVSYKDVRKCDIFNWTYLKASVKYANIVLNSKYYFLLIKHDAAIKTFFQQQENIPTLKFLYYRS